MSYPGQDIRERRVKQNLILRQVAIHIEVNTALMSKAERGERNLNCDQVLKLAKYFSSPEEGYISFWLCGKIMVVVNNDPLTSQGIKKALTKIKN